jgi:hypothetical protein
VEEFACCAKEHFDSDPTDLRFRLRAELSKPPREAACRRQVEVAQSVWQELRFLAQLLADPSQVCKVDEISTCVFDVRQAFFAGVDMGIGNANIVSANGVLIDAVADFARKTKKRRLLAVTLGPVAT